VSIVQLNARPLSIAPNAAGTPVRACRGQVKGKERLAQAIDRRAGREKADLLVPAPSEIECLKEERRRTRRL